MNKLKAVVLLSHCLAFIPIILVICLAAGYDPLGVGLWADNHPLQTVSVLVLIFAFACLSAIFYGKKTTNTAKP